MRLALLLCASLASAASGNVVFLGSVVESGTLAGHPSSNIFDGDFSTFWTASGTNGWVGMDMGASVQLTSVIVTPRTDNDDCITGQACWDRGLGANVIEGANASNFTGAVTLATLTMQPLISQLAYNTISVTDTGHRYYRLRSPSGYGDLAELRFVGIAVGGVNARPVAPVISPYGGVDLYPLNVAMSSQTTSATMHYTTDGSTPTCSSAAYTTPISVSSAITISAIACDATLSTPGSEVSQGIFRASAFAVDAVDYDASTGVPAQMFAGGMYGPVNGTYYQTGMWLSGGPCGQLAAAINPCSSIGTWLYSSRDVLNWTLESQILDDGRSAGHTWTQVQRSHIVFNASTGKYVMWSHCQGPDWSQGNGKACIATASAITGPWTWANVNYDPGNGYRDCNLFLDDDGTGYTVATDDLQASMWIYTLAPDYLTVISGNRLQVVTGSFESPILIKRGIYYYLIYGPTTYYNQTTDPLWISATSILGTWSSPAHLYIGGPPTGFQGQPTFVMHLPNFIDAWMIGSDRWNASSVASSHLQRNPLVFSTDTPPVPSVDTTNPWDFSRYKSRLFPQPGPGRVK